MSAVTIDRPIKKRITLTSVMKMMARSSVMVRNTWQTKTDDILLKVDSPEGANTLTEKVRQAVAGKTRVTHPERRTPILLLDMASWADEADMMGGLTTISVMPDESANISSSKESATSTQPI